MILLGLKFETLKVDVRPPLMYYGGIVMQVELINDIITRSETLLAGQVEKKKMRDELEKKGRDFG
jgi:hypothetical protein